MLPDVRQLFPEPADVEPLVAYGSDGRPAPAGRPWVLLGMIASADGATAVDGRSGQLGGAADKSVFAAVRHVADLIVVGSATARAENYGPPVMNDAARAARVARGQAPMPHLAVVSGSLDFDLTSRLFTGWPDDARPIVITAESAPPERRRALEAVADVEVDGERVSVGGILDVASKLEAKVVLVEGGPHLNGQFVEVGTIDELCLTIAPLIVGGPSPSIAVGDHGNVLDMRIDRLLEQDGLLFCRYVNAASVPSPS
jgi:riboflavin biosynthesis pyrimidine reductase